MAQTKVIALSQSARKFFLLCASLILLEALPLLAQGPNLETRAAFSESYLEVDNVPAATEAVPSAPDSSSAETTFSASTALPAGAIAYEPVVLPRPETQRHAFWDRKNSLLFVANGAVATADFFTTRCNLASGGKELNPFTRVLAGSTPGLAANFALETGGLVGMSYLLHRTGHHKLERILPAANLGVSAGAVAYNSRH